MPEELRYGGDSQRDIVEGDFNKDGKMDLATANYHNWTISVYMGNGDGTFQLQKNYYLEDWSWPSSITTGDVNNDGNLDLAVANWGRLFSYSAMSVFLGNGDGTFQPKADYGFSYGAWPHSITMSDFNMDGKTDIAVGIYNIPGYGKDIVILMGNGEGFFQQQSVYATAGGSVSIIANDINVDGWIDLITSNVHTNSISVLLGNGDGTFQTHKDYEVGTNPWAVIAEDFDKDGKVDLAVVSYMNVFILLENGDGTFRSKTNYEISGKDIAKGDFDNDGNVDLAIASSSGIVPILLGNGDGTFRRDRDYGGLNGGPAAIVSADFNGDGWTDIATGNYIGDIGAVSVWKNVYEVTVGDTVSPQTNATINGTPTHEG